VDRVYQEFPALPTVAGDGKWEPAQLTGAELYGAPEDEANIDDFAEAEPRPLTWRGALYVIEALLRTFSTDKYGYEHNFKHSNGGITRVLEWEPGWLARSLAKLEASVVQEAAGLAQATTKLQQCPAEAS